MRAKLAQLQELPYSFHVEIRAGEQVRLYGPAEKAPRSGEIGGVIRDLAKMLPDITLHISAHDTGSILFSEDMRRDAATLVEASQRKLFASSSLQPRR